MKDFKRATLYSAGYDVFVKGNIPAGKTVQLKTDINLFGILKKNQFGMLVARSSLFMKHNLTIPNTPRIIDADFNECFSVELHNHTDKNIYINDKVAQIIIQEYHTYKDEIKPTKERDGGFGSTDKNETTTRISNESWKEFQKITKQYKNEILDFVKKIQRDDNKSFELRLLNYNTVITFNGPGNYLEISTSDRNLRMSSKHALTMLFRVIEKFANCDRSTLDSVFTNIKTTKKSRCKQLFDYTKEDFYL